MVKEMVLGNSSLRKVRNLSSCPDSVITKMTNITRLKTPNSAQQPQRTEGRRLESYRKDTLETQFTPHRGFGKGWEIVH
ncbi:hypothetical protein M513_10905 [Trichuris suis]|uniref:Uncharacterized protein n=1 Tax=Trichuris suis TaxID=68888 RepID=A0A085LT95_9BILA|nr:hypothetical protein M513_10905 [Trichuris suis]